MLPTSCLETAAPDPSSREKLVYDIVHACGMDRSGSEGNWLFLSLLVRATELAGASCDYSSMRRALEDYANRLISLVTQVNPVESSVP
jgi:hypothetical protein